MGTRLQGLLRRWKLWRLKRRAIRLADAVIRSLAYAEGTAFINRLAQRVSPEITHISEREP